MTDAMEQPNKNSPFADSADEEAASPGLEDSPNDPISTEAAANKQLYYLDLSEDGAPVHLPPADANVMTIDPDTPGRLVDTGQEATGRWTKEEHDAFLSALRIYGKEWKKVAAKVKTRTVVQTRTHAQKYFQKLQKVKEFTGNGDIPFVNMGVESTAQKKSKRSASRPQSTRKRKASAAASVYSLYNAEDEDPASLPPPPLAPPSYLGRRSSTGTLSAAHMISSFSNSAQKAAARNDASVSLYSTPSWTSARGPMKIHAPELSLRNQFPEPSPAATGKRKLAEIAAARMLAAAGEVPYANEDRTPTPPPPAPSLSRSAPPPPPLFGNGADTLGMNEQGHYAQDLSALAKKPLSLQIVNPDSLPGSALSHRGKGDSPQTPWEGDMEALLSQGSSIMSAVKDGHPSTPDKEDAASTQKKYPSPPSMQLNNYQEELPVCGPSTAYNRSKLHAMVCEMDTVGFQNELDMELEKHAATGIGSGRVLACISRVDDAGYAPLHTAAALRMKHLSNSTAACEIAKVLLTTGAQPNQVDSEGNTPLHWAARSGDVAVARALLYGNAKLDAINNRGETPMHWAMRAGPMGEDVVAFLIENGVKGTILNNSFRRPLDVAAEGFHDEETSLATLKEKNENGDRVSRELRQVLKETELFRQETRANFLLRLEQARTLVLHHAECLEHHPKSDTDWEAPDRIVSIMNRVFPRTDSAGNTEIYGIFPHEVTISSAFERARLDLLRRVHTTEYLSFVNNLSKDLERQVKGNGSGHGDDSDSGFNSSPPVIPFTPMVQRTMIKINESEVKQGMHSDTAFSSGSLKAARRAAGAVQHAVDCVLVGRNRNAFCVVRPPGHHAGTTGLLEGGESCGFCIFNNVAAGALYAISEDRLLCERCAIVDLDVHHGNGTEEIVRKYHDPKKLFFFSIHLFDNDKKKKGGTHSGYQFYPGTGDEDDLALNIVNVPIMPLWKDKNNQVENSGGRFHNTRQKSRGSSSQEDVSEGGSTQSDEPSETGSSQLREGAPQSSSTARAATFTSGRLAYREAIRSRLLPALRAFDPDLILISAGFDASRGDVGNARHDARSGKERMGMDLDPEDYAWTTRQILQVADICCNGRVVSVLEGGYGRPKRSSQEKGLDRSMFAECAVRHLHALIDPYNTEQRFSSG